MPDTWTITNNTQTGTSDLADICARNLRCQFHSLSADTFEFDCAGAEIDYDGSLPGAFPLADDDNVSIKFGATQVFRGNARVRRIGGIDGERIRVVIDGPWKELEERTAYQPWKVLTESTVPEDPAEDVELVFEDIEQMRFILYHDHTTGDRLSTTQQIQQIVQRAAGDGAALASGTYFTGFSPTFEEVKNVMMSELIIQILRNHPDAVAWFDHSASAPTFNCGKAAQLAEWEVDLSTVDLKNNDIVARKDLQAAGVQINFDQPVTVDGKVYIGAPVEQVAGSGVGAGRVVAAQIELAGTRVTLMRQEVETETYPDAVDTETPDPVEWWQERLDKWFRDIPAADLKMISHSVDPDDDAADISDLTKELVQGTITDWMGDRNGETVLAEPVTATAVLSYTGTDELIAARFDEFNQIQANFSFIATNAVTKEYTGIDSFEQPEEIPSGMASALYAGCGHLHYEGEFSIQNVYEPPTVLGLGRRVNMTGGRSEWESMDGMVTDVSWDISAGVQTVRFGPPGHYGIHDFIEMMRSRRGPTASYSVKDREEGEALGSLTSVRGGAIQPRHNSSLVNGSGSVPFTPIIAGNADDGWELGCRGGQVAAMDDDGSITKLNDVAPDTGITHFWIQIDMDALGGEENYRTMNNALLDSGTEWPTGGGDDTQYWRLFSVDFSGSSPVVTTEWKGSICWSQAVLLELAAIDFIDCDGSTQVSYDPYGEDIEVDVGDCSGDSGGDGGSGGSA
jgi:hypothetical protein